MTSIFQTKQTHSQMYNTGVMEGTYDDSGATKPKYIQYEQCFELVLICLKWVKYTTCFVHAQIA